MRPTGDNLGPERSALGAGPQPEIGPLSVNEAADLLLVVPRTVIKYIDQGKLRAAKVGVKYRVRLSPSMIAGREAERSERESGAETAFPGHLAGASTADPVH